MGFFLQIGPKFRV
jgi:hypothetical protein